MSAPTLSKGLGNPFPGLRPFRESEEHLFFGRERQTAAMVDVLARDHLLAVVGSSGSGKSSLVSCGLRPALHRGLMASAGSDWRVAYLRPGGDPVRALAKALACEGVLFSDWGIEGAELEQVIETTLHMSRLGLLEIVEKARLPQGSNLLIIVDQFEELFRFAEGSEDQASAGAAELVDLLLAVLERRPEGLYLTITMRSDFLGDCARFTGLPEALNQSQYLVPRLTRSERRAVISGPVAVHGAELSTPLLNRLVNDVGDDPDQLSVLQHALHRTWAAWEAEGSEGPLALAHYEQVGEMAQALDRHAEATYRSLGEEQRVVCKRVFRALTDKASDARGVRRPTRLATLCAVTGASRDELAAVIAPFRDPAQSFLMPPAGEPLESETVVDISHESLMRVWERLTRWADEEARSATRYRRLAETADLHADGKASLLVDPELEIALRWAESEPFTEAWARRYRPGFATASSFLEQSREAREAQRRAEELRELTERRRRRKTLFLLSSLSIVALLLAAFGWWSRNQLFVAQGTAEEARVKARGFEDAAKLAQEEAETAKEEATEQQRAADLASTKLETVRADLKSADAGLETARTDLETARTDLETARTDLEAKNAEVTSAEEDAVFARANAEQAQADFDSAKKDLSQVERKLQTTTDPPVLSQLIREARIGAALQRPADWMEDTDALLVRIDEHRAGTPKEKLSFWDARELANEVEVLEELRKEFPRRRALYETDFASDDRLTSLGTDPVSGLREFLLEGSGDRPRRDADGALQVGPSTGVVLVLLPGGVFSMGSEVLPEEQPVRPVSLDPFLISKYELTSAQWARLAPDSSSKNEGDLPLGGVSWEDLEPDLRKHDLLLPTEAQWEYACRGGTRTRYWPGEFADDLEGAGRFNSGSSKPVGGYRANAYGLYDVHGNVSEWCRDLKGSYKVEPRAGDGLRDAGGDSNRRIYRGGGYDEGPKRSAHRFSSMPSKPFPNVGVRPVMSIEP